MILKYSLVSFLPDKPQKEARDKLPKSVEEITIVRLLGPFAKNVCNISNSFSFLASEADFFPESVGQRARDHKVMNRFEALRTVGTLGRSDIFFFNQVVPCEDSFVTEKPEKSRNLGPSTWTPNKLPKRVPGKGYWMH